MSCQGARPWGRKTPLQELRWVWLLTQEKLCTDMATLFSPPEAGNIDTFVDVGEDGVELAENKLILEDC